MPYRNRRRCLASMAVLVEKLKLRNQRDAVIIFYIWAGGHWYMFFFMTLSLFAQSVSGERGDP
jgi:hypothetical protein